MNVFLLLLVIAALVIGLVAMSRGKEANERIDDCMKYLSDLRSGHGGEIRELFRELNRLKVSFKKAQGQLEELPYEITDACVACGTCKEECPEDAISQGDIYRIDPDLCSSCGNCESVCPVDACVQMKID